MPRSPTPAHLDQIRRHILARVRQLRRQRGWTQGDLAAKLGLSQARLSEVERGDGSLTAEQLVEVLRLFNLRLEEVVGLSHVEDELQSSLARLGALHLRESPSALPSERVASARAAIRETLLAPRDTRLLLALGPVLVCNIDAINLHTLHDELARLGFPARLPWLVENVRAALDITGAGGTGVGWRRAETVLSAFLDRHAPHRETAEGIDHIDPGVRSMRTLAQVQEVSSEISRRWGVLSELQPADFADAMEAARAAG